MRSFRLFFLWVDFILKTAIVVCLILIGMRFYAVFPLPEPIGLEAQLEYCKDVMKDAKDVLRRK